ncbi:secreted protein, partial [Candidatus Magnetomorum sp. HK-1]
MIMIIRIICLFVLAVNMVSNAHALEAISDGFDYPVGNRGYDNNGNKTSLDEHINDFGNNYNVDRNEEYNFYKGIADNNSRRGSSGSYWFNINDTG